MIQILNIFQIIVSVLLIIGILLQQRGGGLSPVLGGEGGAYRTRRGVEKGVFIATIILATLFLLSAIFHIILVK